MNHKIMSAIGISLFLAGCQTTAPSTPDSPPALVLTKEEEASMRQQMAIRIESSVAAYAVLGGPSFKSATISAPYETTVLLKGRATRYCVNAVMDTALMSSSLRATITISDTLQDGLRKRQFEMRASRGMVDDCRMIDPQPFPELIQLREQRRARDAAEAAANPPGFPPK